MLSRKFNIKHWLIFFESCVSLNSLEIFVEKALINSLKSRRDISHWLQVTSFRRTGFECSTIKDRQVPAGESPDCNQFLDVYRYLYYIDIRIYTLTSEPSRRSFSSWVSQLHQSHVTRVK